MGRTLHYRIVLCFLTFALFPASSGRFIADKRSSQSGQSPTFRIVTIGQEIVDNVHKVRLQLAGSHMPRVYLMFSADDGMVEIPVAGDGKVEFEQRTPGLVDLMLWQQQGFHTLQLTVGNDTVLDQPLPQVDFGLTSGSGEIVFERGVDSFVSVYVHVHNTHLDIDHLRLYHDFSRQSVTHERVVLQVFEDSRDIPVDSLYDGLSAEGSYRFRFLRVRTSDDVEGLLELEASFGFNCVEGVVDPCLRGHYTVHKDVPVYRSDHSGPFPDNFIGFVMHLYEDNVTQEICSLHNPNCLLACQFTGDHPSMVAFSMPDNADASLSSRASQISMHGNAFHATGELTIHSAIPADQGVYRCSSGSAGVEQVSRDVELLVIHDPLINKDLTTITTMDDGSVQATCVAEGTPPPTISFYSNLNGSLFADVNSPLYDVIVMPPNGSTSSAVLRLKDSSVADSVAEVTCVAENTIRGLSFSDSTVLRVGQS